MSGRAGWTASLLACLTLASALSVSVPPMRVAGADDPVAAVEELLDAVTAGDAAVVDALVREAQRQPLRRVFDVRGQLGIPGTGMLEPALAFDIADRDLTLADDQGELATVRLRARLTIELDDDRVRDLVRDMLAPGLDIAADEGTPVSEADLEILVPFVRDVLAAG
jgi:hypothetical protein